MLYRSTAMLAVLELVAIVISQCLCNLYVKMFFPKDLRLTEADKSDALNVDFVMDWVQEKVEEVLQLLSTKHTKWSWISWGNNRIL